MSKQDKLVSIIVPAYNVDSYIESFMDCIINQTYMNWELIIVDDGSTDNTVNLVNRYKDIDKRIKLVIRDRLPKGSVVCRNIGQSLANGDYIIHFDSDDVIAKHCLEQRVSFMLKHRNVDYATFKGISVVSSDKGELIPVNKQWGTPLYNDILKYFLEVNYPFSIWNNIYKAEVFKTVEWDEQVKIYTDFSYIVPVLLNKRYYHSFAKDSICDYFYITNRNNSMTSNFLSQEKYESTKYLFNKTMRQLQNSNKFMIYKNSFRKFFCLQIERIIINNNKKQIDDFYNFFKYFYDKNYRLEIIIKINIIFSLSKYKYRRLVNRFLFIMFFNPQEVLTYICSLVNRHLNKKYKIILK